MSPELDKLNRDDILALLSDDFREQVSLNVFSSIDSTNQYLLSDKNLTDSSPVFCLADEQTAGRGRLGRQWHSPAGHHIYLSCRRHMACPPETLSALSLAMGLAIVKVLAPYSTRPLQIKWPNDIFCEDKKLAGILIETINVKSKSCSVVVGMGINIHPENMQDETLNKISLREFSETLPSRNQLVAALVVDVADVMQIYEKQGFQAFKPEWANYDYLKGKNVSVRMQGEILKGKVLGVDTQGALQLLQADGNFLSCHSGEASLELGKFNSKVIS